ncbi:MAG: hypothetical protein IT270_09840 [Saprospiraceae bacterium]|nr:hypothetical protein [Saprospiraceae bacterium]
MQNPRLLPILLCAAMFLPALFLGYGVERSQFGLLVASYGIWFVLYLYVLWRWGDKPEHRRLLLGAGVVLRVAMVFGLPLLSDDIYRFLWDGRLWAAGIHPFLYTPREFLELGLSAPGIDADLFARLNSPDYHTVYPPLAQSVFYLSALVGTASLWPGVLVIKLFLLACELGTLYLLHRRFPIGRGALLYALNPLPILEICGNAHFEGAAVFFVMLGLLALNYGRAAFAATSWALAVAAKLVPLLFVPLILRYLGWKKGLVFSAVFGVACLALFVPMFNLQVLQNMASSLDLYFQKFAFNASLFYVFWEIGLYFGQYTMDKTLGPIMAIFAAGGILVLAWKLQKGKVMYFMLAASLWHLLWSSTVHPWYLCLPLVLVRSPKSEVRSKSTVDSRQSAVGPSTFVLFWSGTVVLSYSHYAGGGFQENYGLIAAEYLGALALVIIQSRLVKIRG